MRKLTDMIIAVQFATSCAFACAIGAHLVTLHAHDNWQFSVYFLLVASMLFMLFPHLINKEIMNETCTQPCCRSLRSEGQES